jgi:hypothetical protein
MHKDIFLDSNIVKNFSNPLDIEYKKLFQWISTIGYLVVSQKLLVEYGRTNQNLSVLVNKLLADGRLIKFESKELNKIKFKKSILKTLKSNTEDQLHMKVILLSDRKIAIIIDKNFRSDVNNYPKFKGIKPQAVARPEEINYE